MYALIVLPPAGPLDQRFDRPEIPRPDGAPFGIVTAEKLIGRSAVHGRRRRRHADEIGLVTPDPGELGIRARGAVTDEIGLAVGRMLHVLAEIDHVRRADLDLAAVLAALAEQRTLGCMGAFLPGLAEIV